MALPLPSEMVDEILRHLHDDHAALAACSLVCSKFLRCTRQHLFCEVVLDCCDLLAFLQLLDVPWSTIAPAVVRIVLCEQTGMRHLSRSRRNPTNAPINPARLRIQLRGIRSIRFANISLRNVPPLIYSLLWDLKGVEELEFHQISFERLDRFLQHLGSLPALRSLSISWCSWDAPPSGCNIANFRLKRPLSIPLLDVGRFAQRALLEWLLVQTPIPSTRTFRISLDVDATGLPVIREFLELTGATIQNLHITLPFYIAPDPQAHDAIDFSQCRRIRSVRIEGLRIGHQSETSTLFLMRRLVSQLSSPLLNEVSLWLYIIPSNDDFMFFGMPDLVLLESFNWGALARMLQDSFGARLKKLDVVIQRYPKVQQRQTEQFLRKGPFSIFDLRGVLHVDFPSPVVNT